MPLVRGGMRRRRLRMILIRCRICALVLFGCACIAWWIGCDADEVLLTMAAGWAIAGLIRCIRYEYYGNNDLWLTVCMNCR